MQIGLFNQITLEHCPGLTNLLADNERIDELMKLSPEAILLRWVNHQLERSGTNRRCNNFTSDITDSEVYTYLLKQIAPNDAGVTLEAMRVRSLSLIHLCKFAQLPYRGYANQRSFENYRLAYHEYADGH